MTLGDPKITIRSPSDHHVTHIPQKFCVLHSKCSITNQCEPQWNGTTQDKLLNDKMIMIKHFTVQSSVTTECVPSFHSKNVNCNEKW